MMNRLSRPRRSSRLAMGAASLAALVALLSAVVASASVSSKSTTRDACGTIPTTTPNDPGHLLKNLPANLQAAYNGYPGEIVRSRWAHWKPAGKPPYVVGLSWGPQTNPFQQYIFNLIQKFLKRSPLVKSVIAENVQSPIDLQGEINNFQSELQQNPAIMIAQFTNGAAGLPYIGQAANRGVPTILNFSTVDSRDSVDLVPNDFAAAAQEASSIVKALGGKGNVLFVHGIRTVSVDQNAFNGVKAVLANCPNINVVGEVDGLFSPPVAKQAVLQFLSTHTDPIDAVFQSAASSGAIISAFQQAGRSVPPIMMNFADKGSLAYWSDNRSKGYSAAGSLEGPTAAANLIARIVTRMLAGQGMQYSDLPFSEPIVTNSNIASIDQGWQESDTSIAEQPKATWWSNKDLDRLFAHRKLTKGVIK